MIKKRIFVFFLFLIIPILYNNFTSKTVSLKYDKKYLSGVQDNKWLIKKDYFGDIFLDYESKIKYGQYLNEYKPLINNSNSFELDNFSFQLFNSIALDRKDNVIISPISISYALLMVNNGAKNATSSNIISTLGLDGVKSEYIYTQIQNNIRNFKNKNLYINNSLWIQSDDCYKPNKNYIKYTQDIFDADIFFVDFYTNYKKLIDDINKWTSEKTNYLIEDIVSDRQIKKSTVQVLLNTLYYKNNWSLPFDTTKTKSLLFKGINASFRTAMMYQTNYFYHMKNIYNNYEILKLPFKDSSISLLVFLPDSSITLNDFLFKYDILQFKDDIDILKYKRGSVTLPKFNIDFNISLKEILIDMGMFIPFDPNLANFDKFWDYHNQCRDNPPKHYIDIINHKANFNLDENGIEAVAATSIIMNRITSVNLEKQFNFYADRPFLYVLYDDETQSILFMGQYVGI